jgi:CHAT domain-containing protein
MSSRESKKKADSFSYPQPDEDAEDGVLTAEEIASLDLTAVDWVVVLSACETGVGRLRAGEGVLGLRRAFQTAGADSLIMSLWRVEDDATTFWMQSLYEARLVGRSTAEAVRDASLKSLEDARAAGRNTHPFTWGAFVATGDWR